MSHSDKKREVLSFVILTVFVIITIFPVLSVFTFSFLPDDAVSQYPPKLIPDSISFKNFAYVMKNTTVGRGMLNSAIVVTGSIAMVLVIGSTGAYGAAKCSPKYRTFVYGVLLITQMVPAMANMIPIYTIMSKIGLLNSRLGLILIYTVGNLPLSMLILLGFYKSSIAELEEASMIDGCNWWQAFLYVSLPISKPGLVSAVIFTFAGSWNEFMISKLLITKVDLMTYQVSLYNVMENYVRQDSRYNIMSAAAIIGLLPILIIYATFQRGFTEGMTAGAIK